MKPKLNAIEGGRTKQAIEARIRAALNMPEPWPIEHALDMDAREVLDAVRAATRRRQLPSPDLHLVEPPEK